MSEKSVLHFYRPVCLGESELCFNVEVSAPLDEGEIKILRWLLVDAFEPWRLYNYSSLRSAAIDARRPIIEIGPRLNFATSWNTNALSILKSCGLGEKVTRLEISRRMLEGNISFDRMTECVYPGPLSSFATGQKPAEVYEIPLKEEGLAAFYQVEGLSMDEHDKQVYFDYFVGRCNRNPTIVELMDLNNANSEHSRHGYFRGKQLINGEEMPETLMEIVKSTLEANPQKSIIAFRDNSSAIFGYRVWTIIPDNPRKASKFKKERLTYHILFTAETHNFPTGIAPFPGAQTGAGGRIRDVQATGRGGLMVVGTAGYAVGNLLLPGYKLPWEKRSAYPDSLASARDILIFGSDGVTRYGNEIGEPVIQGFTRAGASYLSNGERREYLKPILFTGGLGQIDGRHVEKQRAQAGMLIIQIGGPAYRIGFGGGAASSLLQGDNPAELDFNAVQRGDAEMEQKVNRVVRACVELGTYNPIISIHDQGAGGPANVLKELVEKAGGQIDIRKINVGDSTLSVTEIWVAEYQERNGLLIRPENLEEFLEICAREKVNCEVLGEVTGDGIFTVYDSFNDSYPVRLDLEAVLGGMPQKTFVSEDFALYFKPLMFPENLSFFEALKNVLRLPTVGSKRFLTNKGDRSVTGLVAQQQCCGPMQLPVADVAVIAQSHFINDEGVYSGAAMSIGEQPIKMLVSPEAGARMAVAEALTNIASAHISNITDIKCSANWMAAPKLEGEGPRMYRAAKAMRDIMISLRIAVDGGKDSLSMATRVKHPDGQTEIVKSAMELVISAYCTVPDITRVMTPDIKYPGKSRLMRIDVADGRRRLGGSALAQVYGQLGNDCPDIESPDLLAKAFGIIQYLISDDFILSCHDISDGGAITSLLEMVFAGNCGFEGIIKCSNGQEFSEFFAEEAGWLIEYLPENEEIILSSLRNTNIPHQILGKTTIDKMIKISGSDNEDNTTIILEKEMGVLRGIWEETSYHLEELQCDRSCAYHENLNIFDLANPPYSLSFVPKLVPENFYEIATRPKVAIIREEGSNGDREMASYFHLGGFETWDVNMVDLLSGKISLEMFRGLAFVGGFSYADVLDSAKGWSATIMFNERLKKMFDDFYNRRDTFSLSVCNGCQLAALLGWVPGVEKGVNKRQLQFTKNKSGRFESRFLTVKILESPAMMLKGMEGSILGIWSAHGEGLLRCDASLSYLIQGKNLAPIRFVDHTGQITEKYPFNPNGSFDGITGICDISGRHLAMMPHPERSFLKWQLAYMPLDWHRKLESSPWMQMVQNAYEWCNSH